MLTEINSEKQNRK